MRTAVISAAALVATSILLAQHGLAQDRGGGIAGGCTPNTGPDVIVGDLSGITKHGTVGDVTGYSIGTTSCNIGNENLLWVAASNQHPVIAQNLYRLKDGEFEQLGMSWLKHGFTALTQNLCCTCNGAGGSVLGVGCSDPYSSGLNGDQNGFSCGGGNICGGLGPRFEVNAAAGEFAYPYDSAGASGNAIYKRLQVHNDDLDPTLNPGALYYGEGHYVSPDDAEAGNQHNNASYESVNVGTFSGGGWSISFTGSTTRELAAIYAWQDADPAVAIEIVDDFAKGRFLLGYRVTDNGDGTWHYEYALHNLNSHRSARTFSVPVPAGVVVSNVEFHDVDYHSGDGNGGVTYDGTDWAPSIGAGSASWSTQTEAENDNANALRWGTLYNFRFDANAGPVAADATIGLFRAGTPADLTVATLGPDEPLPCPWDCADNDGMISTVDLLELLSQWGSGGTCDFDGGGVATTDLLELLANWGPCF